MNWQVSDETRYAWHANGIHTECEPVRKWWQGITGGVPFGAVDHTNCPYAGTTARFHSHDFDGPLPCDCDDFDLD